MKIWTLAFSSLLALAACGPGPAGDVSEPKILGGNIPGDGDPGRTSTVGLEM